MKHYARLVSLLTVLPLWSGLQAAEQSTPKLKVFIDTVGVWQDLEHKNANKTLPNLESGFQAALGNLRLETTLADGIDVYAEFYLSSKHHPGYLMDREGYMLIRNLPTEYSSELMDSLFRVIDLKVGHFEIDFGNQRTTRSDNAQVQQNPLIGNSLTDPNTVEAGAELIAHLGVFHILAGFGNGVTVEDFQNGRDYSKHYKIFVEPEDKKYQLAASYYEVDHSGNPTGYPLKGSYAELFAGNRSGSRYSGVIDGGAEAGQVSFGRGQDVSAWQVDAGFKAGPVTTMAYFGSLVDRDINGSEIGSPDESWTYGAGEISYAWSEKFYLASRYSSAQAKTLAGLNSDGTVDRIQTGAGFWLLKTLLLKGEYVEQKYRHFTAVYPENPEFKGFLAEISATISN